MRAFIILFVKCVFLNELLVIYNTHIEPWYLYHIHTFCPYCATAVEVERANILPDIGEKTAKGLSVLLVIPRLQVARMVYVYFVLEFSCKYVFRV